MPAIIVVTVSQGAANTKTPEELAVIRSRSRFSLAPEGSRKSSPWQLCERPARGEQVSSGRATPSGTSSDAYETLTGKLLARDRQMSFVMKQSNLVEHGELLHRLQRYHVGILLPGLQMRHGL